VISNLLATALALDFAKTFRACAEVGNRAPLNQTVHEWKATAVVYTDPDLLQALTEPANEDFGPVPPPEGGSD
jgi:hypothetical protein